MKKIPVTKRHLELLEKAVRFTIADLMFEKHEARKHGCFTNAYDKEIEEYKQLKSLLQ